MLRRWLLYVGSVLLGLCLVGGLLGRFRAGAPLSDASLARKPDRLPPQDSVAGRFRRGRHPGRIRRGAAGDRRHSRSAGRDDKRHSGGRGRALLLARGVDYLSVMRAAATNLASGTQQGAGTITMQVARNFFLTREKTITRKLREVLLAWKIEANLSKDEILQLYVNQIFLGQRAYGFAAASQIYFGKPLQRPLARRGGDARRLAQSPVGIQPGEQPQTCENPPVVCTEADARPEVHQFRAIPGSTNRAARRPRRAARDAADARASLSPKWHGRSSSTPTARTPTPRA